MKGSPSEGASLAKAPNGGDAEAIGPSREPDAEQNNIGTPSDFSTLDNCHSGVTIVRRRDTGPIVEVVAEFFADGTLGELAALAGPMVDGHDAAALDGSAAASIVDSAEGLAGEGVSANEAAVAEGPTEGEPESTPVARIALARATSLVAEASVDEVADENCRRVVVCLQAPSGLIHAAGGGYVTLTLPSGRVVYEGSFQGAEPLEIAIDVGVSVQELNAMLDLGTLYRNARVKLADGERTEYVFR